MVIYSCELCDYNTTHKGAFKRHCETNKHQKNIKICNSIPNNVPIIPNNVPTIPNNNEIIPNNKNICKFCKKTYKYKCHLTRHLKTCVNKNDELDELKKINEELKKNNKNLLENEIKIQKQHLKLIQQNMNLTTEISMLKDRIHKLEHEVKDTEIKYLKKDRNVTKNSHNITQYITNKYPNAPNINPINKLDNYEKYVYSCEDNKAEHNKAIASLINNHYCKDIPPEKRSIWCVDSSRDKFILRENDTWNTDIHGNEFCKKVINPLGKLYTEYTNQLIKEGVKGVSGRIMGLMYFNMYIMGLSKLPKTVLPYLIVNKKKKKLKESLIDEEK